MKKYAKQLFLIVLITSCNLKDLPDKASTVKSATISVRNAHSMVYHARDSQVYLFGGANEKEVLSDLWVLDSISWQHVTTNQGPEARTFAAMTYNHQLNNILLFGGSKVLFGKEPDVNNLLNDTWQFSNNQWKRIRTELAPSPRAEAEMVYDVHRDRVVLFGGYTLQNGKYIKLGDTWEFYNDNWHLANESGPSNRHGVAMVYDSQQKRVVLFGGSTVDKQYGNSTGETWAWDGKTWNKLDIEQPPGVFNAAMSYNTDKSEFVRFGGWNGSNRIDETWIFNQQWKKLKTENSPASRNHSRMVYDEKRNKAILFGGHDGENIFGDTWEFSNNQWNNITNITPLKRIKNGH